MANVGAKFSISENTNGGFDVVIVLRNGKQEFWKINDAEKLLKKPEKRNNKPMRWSKSTSSADFIFRTCP